MAIFERVQCPRCHGCGWTPSGEDCFICGHTGVVERPVDALRVLTAYQEGISAGQERLPAMRAALVVGRVGRD
jgi:hypothetical protein